MDKPSMDKSAPDELLVQALSDAQVLLDEVLKQHVDQTAAMRASYRELKGTADRLEAQFVLIGERAKQLNQVLVTKSSESIGTLLSQATVAGQKMAAQQGEAFAQQVQPQISQSLGAVSAATDRLRSREWMLWATLTALALLTATTIWNTFVTTNLLLDVAELRLTVVRAAEKASEKPPEVRPKPRTPGGARE